MRVDQATDVQLVLTADEAVVLFEFLRRYSDSNDLTIVDQAEQRALWNLCCVLERGALAPITGDWPVLLQQARARLRDEK
jgi:hypothetical protein